MNRDKLIAQLFILICVINIICIIIFDYLHKTDNLKLSSLLILNSIIWIISIIIFYYRNKLLENKNSNIIIIIDLLCDLLVIILSIIFTLILNITGFNNITIFVFFTLSCEIMLYIRILVRAIMNLIKGFNTNFFKPLICINITISIISLIISIFNIKNGCIDIDHDFGIDRTMWILINSLYIILLHMMILININIKNLIINLSLSIISFVSIIWLFIGWFVYNKSCKNIVNIYFNMFIITESFIILIILCIIIFRVLRYVLYKYIF